MENLSRGEIILLKEAYANKEKSIRTDLAIIKQYLSRVDSLDESKPIYLNISSHLFGSQNQITINNQEFILDMRERLYKYLRDEQVRLESDLEALRVSIRLFNEKYGEQ